MISLFLANSHRLFITSTPPSPNSNASPAASPVLLPSVAPMAATQNSAPVSCPALSSVPPLHVSISSSDLKVPTSPTSVSSFPTRSAKKLAPAPYGVVSIGDVLTVFARLAGLQDVDPNNVRKHRRGSSAFSSGSADGGRSGRSTPSPTISRLRGYSASPDSRIH